MTKPSRTDRRIGLALGGGGARGVGHVPILEVFDALGIRPALIAGTSVGSVMGALYASGLSGHEIKDLIDSVTISEDDSVGDVLKKKGLLRWFEALVPDFRGGGLLRSDRILSHLFDAMRKNRFEELDIPLKVIAADYWTSEQVVFEHGELMPALQASIAVPGVFRPMEYSGHVLVDGGIVNLVPYDLLAPHCDLTVAVNVAGRRERQQRAIPHKLDCILGSFDTLQDAQLEQKLARKAPDIYVAVDLTNIEPYEFDKADHIYRAALPAAKYLESELVSRL